MLTPHMSWLGGRAVPPRTCPPTGAWASLADIMPTRPRNPVHRKAPKYLFTLVLPRQLPQVAHSIPKASARLGNLRVLRIIQNRPNAKQSVSGVQAPRPILLPKETLPPQLKGSRKSHLHTAAAGPPPGPGRLAGLLVGELMRAPPHPSPGTPPQPGPRLLRQCSPGSVGWGTGSAAPCPAGHATAWQLPATVRAALQTWPPHRPAAGAESVGHRGPRCGTSQPPKQADPQQSPPHTPVPQGLAQGRPYALPTSNSREGPAGCRAACKGLQP